jgi:predicted aspartyl protease
MGMTELRIRLVNLADRTRATEVDMVVDSGAIYSVVPAKVLKAIGIEPRSLQSFGLADGSSVQREIGDVLYEIEGCSGAAPVIFGRRGDSNLLGGVTLEALGLRLDPLKRQLRPLKLMIA